MQAEQRNPKPRLRPSITGSASTNMAPRILTRDELQALTLYAHGLSTDEVAQQLHVHHAVAQDWLRVAARKLGATNRVHAVAIAMELGIIRFVRGPMRR
jgi:DNA-binding NarL/FixJ family response regulator